MLTITLAIFGGILTGLFGMIPLWNSAVLSPDSIMRRSYWTGSGLMVLAVLLMPSDWPGRIFGAVIVSLALALMAVRGRHIKIRGRIITSALDTPRPDRSPELSPHREEWEL